MTSTFNWRAGAAAAALFLVGASAQAATIQLTYQNNLSGPSGGITGWSNVYAGEFEFSTAGDTMYWDDGLSAFCIEISTTLRGTANYSVSSGLGGFSNVQQGRIDALFSNFYASSQESAHNSAAFQLALWEILEEPLDYGLDLNGGMFTASGFGGAVDTANAWLADLGTGTGQYEFYVFSSGKSQDLLAVRPVPEPGMIALLGAGLLGVALLRVRRRSADAAAT